MASRTPPFLSLIASTDTTAKCFSLKEMTWHTYCYLNLTRPLQLLFFLVFSFLLFCHLFHPLLHLRQSLALPSPPRHLHNLLRLCPHHPLVPFFFCPFFFCSFFHLILPSLRWFSGEKIKKNLKTWIVHFGVPKTLTFKTRLSAKPFLRKWVYEFYWKRIKTDKTMRSVHFGVVVVELINCKCGGIVRNERW